MRFYIAKYGENPIEITDSVDVEKGWQITQTLERWAFAREHGDLKLTLSDMNGKIESLLFSAASGWELTAKEGRVIFCGDIDMESVTKNIIEEKISFTAYSKTKLFWEWAKANYICNISSSRRTQQFIDPIYYQLSLETILNWNLDKRQNKMVMETLYDGIEIDSAYQDVSIRFALTMKEIKERGTSRNWGSARPDNLPNYSDEEDVHGRYINLAPNTTIAALLETIEQYLNAEIFIEPETRVLKLSPRKNINNNVEKRLDDIIDTRVEVEISKDDGERYDYIRALTFLPRANKPEFYAINVYDTETEQNWGRPAIKVSYIFTDGTESQMSDEVEIPITLGLKQKAMILIYFRNVSYPDPSKTLRAIKFYGRNTQSTSGYKALNEKSVDGYSLPYIFAAELYNPMKSYSDAPTQFGVAMAYIGYDIKNERWLDPIYDWENKEISGKIFSIESNIKFVDLDPDDSTKWVERANQEMEIFHFFREDVNLATLYKRWQNVLLPASKLHCAVSDETICIGDLLKLENLPRIVSKQFVARKVTRRMPEEITEIEVTNIYPSKPEESNYSDVIGNPFL